jgi:transaldolase
VRGTLQRYVRDFAVSGLTSNPTIFEHAIRNTNLYDGPIRAASTRGRSAEPLFLDLALEDLTEAADLFRPIHDATAGLDGWALLVGAASISIRSANEGPHSAGGC